MSQFERWLEAISGTGGILAYHGIAPKCILPVMHVDDVTFRQQLDFIAAEYHVIPLSEYLARRAANRSNDGCVSITFDDAYVGIREYAASVLRELDMPATIFVVTEAAQVGSAFWWDLIECARLDQPDRWHQHLTALQLPGWSPGVPASTIDLVRNRVLVRFEGRYLFPTSDELRSTMWRSLTYEELGDLALDHRFEFGCHTATHPSLTRLSYEAQVFEIASSFAELRGRLPRVGPFLAYPYGLYDLRTVRAAKEAGMAACVTMEGRAPGYENQFEVPRIGVGAVHSLRSIARRLDHKTRPLLVLRNRGWRPRLPLDPAL